MDSNNRPKIIMKAPSGNAAAENSTSINEISPASNPNPPAIKPTVSPKSAQPPLVDTNSPLAKGLPTSWSVEPPEMPVRRKGVK